MIRKQLEKNSSKNKKYNQIATKKIVVIAKNEDTLKITISITLHVEVRILILTNPVK